MGQEHRHRKDEAQSLSSPQKAIGTNSARGVPIVFRNVTKRFGSFTALDGFSMAIEEGEFLTILGESGSGKSTILNALAGFIPIDDGEISINGKAVHTLPPEQRGVGMVFQNYSLFPHMDVADNVAFPLRMRGVPKQEARKRGEEALGIVRLSGLGHRFPRELSGGQQQRVAVARAISFHPRVLLMDEPLGALDLKLREALQFEIKQIQRSLGCTVVYVTHDQREAMAMSDRIMVLRSGRIEQLGSSADLYDRPRTKFVADFIGQTNIVPAVRSGRQVVLDHLGLTITPPAIPEGVAPLFLNLRPEKLMAKRADGQEVEFPAQVQETVFLGDMISVSAVTPSGISIYFRQPRQAGFSLNPGDAIWLSFDPSDAVLVVDGSP
ncbi:ABC transporter ATP-binding protein [Microvirga pudoricolor]|uniref:ABC transporter ATP-binding protein n=1 Tax=Microvirga pudoricolor TaxID=2778729 RepID=UPI00195074C6|nr:ABC transporter ATP-binding protein [Microvirga pudoricolor]MBM6593102.1 ABC transporter ATP-binding protein [Microvirga pudoricolor]